MTEPKKLIVNLFEMNTVSHISHGMWQEEDNNRHRFNELSYWTELAQIAEDGGLDGIFLADVVGAYDTFRGGLEVALREGMQIPNNDPMLVVPAMAAVTDRLGFGMTFSTTYEQPFGFARRMSTLDHLTNGRVGWNVVTSYLPNAAENFGFTEEMPKAARYARADEFLDVTYKLWEGSWDDDAVVVDRERRVFTDPAKVRYINHVGENYSVRGPHLSQPSRQRIPVLYTATGSPEGTAFAGKHAEVMFTGGNTVEAFRTNAERARTAARAHGRDAEHDLRFIIQAGIITGRTQADVDRKVERFQRNSSLEALLAHHGHSFDLTVFAPELSIAEVIAQTEDGATNPYLARLDPTATVETVLENIRIQREGRFFVAGTPDVVADEIEVWLDEAGIDGINLRQYHSYETLRDFTELVVPELRRRGRLREVGEPTTLRDRLFGGGDRLPATHPSARYRGGANLN